MEENKLKAFKSCNIIDQHTLARQTLPNTLCELYQKCDIPPQLDILNPYRNEEKSALRYYTDPSYFFDLWKKEMLKECGNVRQGRSARSPINNAQISYNKSPSRKRRQRNQESIQNFEPLYQQQQMNQIYQSSLVKQYHNSGNLPNNRFISNSQKHEFLHFPAEYQVFCVFLKIEFIRDILLQL